MKRLLVLIASLLTYSQMSFADINTATSLAQQAGAIAGAASACGQDVSLLSARLQEAFRIMLVDEVQRGSAMMLYLQAYNNAKEMEQTKPQIPCAQVLKDYNGLPILKPDYQTTVLPGLKDTPASATLTTPAISAANDSNNNAALPSPTVMPNTMPAQPGVKIPVPTATPSNAPPAQGN